MSSRRCAEIAVHIVSRRGLHTTAGTFLSQVRTVFSAAVATLAADDQQIPQVGRLLPLLERGIAVRTAATFAPALGEV